MTAIEWTDATWNPTTGCDRVSPGCEHCYAMTLAPRLKAMGQTKYQRDGDPRTSGPGFGITEHPDTLREPLRWRKPRRVFVNSMSDLFHDGVTDDFIAWVWAAMALTRRHTFQVLTKRHGRMRSLLGRPEFRDAVEEHATELIGATPSEFGWRIQVESDWTSRITDEGRAWAPPWPLPNVWLGVSVEDQKRADLRVPALLGTPAAVRFLSCEPLLGPVDLKLVDWDGAGGLRVLERAPRGIDWVIAGGESGLGARPMHPAWARQLRDQCTAARVPFFFKQRGDWTWSGPLGQVRGELYVSRADGRVGSDEEAMADGGEWQGMWRAGKKAAGRELDGRTWNEYPAATP